MLEEDFFMKNYKKIENSGHFEFFRSRKKFTYYYCKILKSFFFITKASIQALVDQCVIKKPQILLSILTFHFMNIGTVIFDTSAEIVHYDTCALSSPLVHGVKLGPERSEGPITPCNGLLKTLVSYNIL